MQSFHSVQAFDMFTERAPALPSDRGPAGEVESIQGSAGRE